MANILVTNNFYQGTSQACVVDLTAPTFVGINFLDVETRGQIRAAWAIGTDISNPIRYEVYIQASTGVGLFNVANIVASTPNLQYDIFSMPDGSFLVNGTTYYVGVRAVDAVGNRDANTVSMSVVSTGVLTSIDTYSTLAMHSIDNAHNFYLTAWANKNDSIATPSNCVLGTASYQVYDKSGATVAMSGSGISANAQGLFVFPAVASLLDLEISHYEVKVTINIDSENRINFYPIASYSEHYKIDGTITTDNLNQVIGSFWAEEDAEIITANLGTGSYEVFTISGISTGLTESGIAADANGIFVTSPVLLPPSFDTSQTYLAKLEIEIYGEIKTTFIKLESDPITYTCKATFSINALNQLQATLWATLNDEKLDPAILGTASYQVYDASGNTVAGLNQSGIVADGQGLFFITPVSAVLLTDLTHYTVKITIEVAGKDREAYKGFTLLGN